MANTTSVCLLLDERSRAISSPDIKSSESNRVAVSVDGTSYPIDPLKIPYFQSYIDFQTKSAIELVDGSIPYFSAAFN